MNRLADRVFYAIAAALVACKGATATDSSKTPIVSVPTEVSHTNVLMPDYLSPSDLNASILAGKVEHIEATGMTAINDKLGFQLRPLHKEILPARITSIVPDSPLAKRGIKVGDRLLAESTNNKSIVLILEHGGQGMRISIQKAELLGYLESETVSSSAQKAELTGSTRMREPNLDKAIKSSLFGYGVTPPQFAQTKDDQNAPIAKKDPTRTTIVVRLNQPKDIKDILVNHDLAIIVDRSGSMSTHDCPSKMSRWKWCCAQASALGEAAAQASSSLTVVFFNDDLRVFEHVNPQSLPELFRTFSPGGGTILGAPLVAVLDHYFSARSKPLIVVVITDGLPSDIRDLAAIVRDASDSLHYAGEVTISFLLIGNQVDAPLFRSWTGEVEGGSIKNGGLLDVISFKNMANEGIKEVLFNELKDINVVTNTSVPSNARAYSTGRPQPLTSAGLRSLFPDSLRKLLPNQSASFAGNPLNPFPSKWLGSAPH